MQSLVCGWCKNDNRVSKPIIVPYIDRRSGERQLFWSCSRCDSVELWPVYTRSSPHVAEET